MSQVAMFAPFLRFCFTRHDEGVAPISLPLYRKTIDSPLRVQLNIGGTNYQCIIDISTSYLFLVSSTSNSADPSQGLYGDDESKKLPDEPMIAEFATAGATGRVIWFNDVLKLSGWAITNGQIQVCVGSLSQSVSSQQFNVLGLGALDTTTVESQPHSGKSFLSQIFGDRGFEEPLFAIQLSPDGLRGSLLLGKVPSNTYRVPLVRAQELEYLTRKGAYVIKVKRAALVSNSGHTLKVINLQYILFDIRTATVFPPSVAPLEVLGSVGISILLHNDVKWFIGTAANQGRLTITPSFDDALLSPPFNGTHCIFGADALRGATFGVDLKTHSLLLGGSYIKEVRM